MTQSDEFAGIKLDQATMDRAIRDFYAERREEGDTLILKGNAVYASSFDFENIHLEEKAGKMYKLSATVNERIPERPLPVFTVEEISKNEAEQERVSAIDIEKAFAALMKTHILKAAQEAEISAPGPASPR